jgi:hypothetical protein
MIGLDILSVEYTMITVTSTISLVATTLMLLRFASTGLRKQFHSKLIASMTAMDFVYSLKALFGILSIGAFKRPRSPGCFVFAFLDKITTMGSQGWNFVLMFNLFLVVTSPQLHARWSKKNALYGAYVMVTLIPAFVVCIGAASSGFISPGFGHKCKVATLSIWGRLELYLLVSYFIWGIFVIFITTRHLGMRMLRVSCNASTRAVIQLVVFTLAFIGTWMWTLVESHAFDAGAAPTLSAVAVFLANTISLGLVGFINSTVWLALTLKKQKPLECSAQLTAVESSSAGRSE